MPDPQYQLTSAPTLAGTTVVVGGRVADNVQTDMPGSVMRGFDVITGKLRWAFDPGNPAITGMPPAGKTYTRSTPNVWAAMSYAKTGTFAHRDVDTTPLGFTYAEATHGCAPRGSQRGWHPTAMRRSPPAKPRSN